MELSIEAALKASVEQVELLTDSILELQKRVDEMAQEVNNKPYTSKEASLFFNISLPTLQKFIHYGNRNGIKLIPFCDNPLRFSHKVLVDYMNNHCEE